VSVNIFKKLVQNDKPLPVLLVFLLFEVCIAVFYFFRFSDVIQDVFNNAYERVLVVLEFHQLVALIFTLIVILIPFNFYYIIETAFRPERVGAYIYWALSVTANIIVSLAEIGVTKMTFDSNTGNLFSAQLSSYGEWTIWGMAVLISMVHQIVTYVSVGNVILLRKEIQSEEH